MLTRDEIENLVPEGDATYDVIVCGGGFAGLGAAVAAARHGARTLLLERTGVLGGVGQICLWMPAANMIKSPPGSGATTDMGMGGVHEMLMDKLKAMGKDAYLYDNENWFRWTSGRGVAIHPDYLQVAAFALLEEVGCHYRLFSPVTGVIRDGNVVNGVTVTSKDGQTNFHARLVIDATGDGDVAFLAGAQTRKGRDSDSLMMPVTRTFVLGNVFTHRLQAFKPGIIEKPHEWHNVSREALEERYKRNPASVTADDDAFYAIIREARERGYLTATWYAFTLTTLPGQVTVNNGGPDGFGNVDGTKTQDLTAVNRLGSQIATDFVEIAHRWQIPGLEYCHLVRIGAQVAIRETRRVIGDLVLTGEDLIQGVMFEDTIAVRSEKVIDTVYYHAEAKSRTGIPLRALLPKGLDGLMVVGRCISTTPEALGGTRGMGTVMGIGQGAGVAAALACRDNVTPREVDVSAVQEALLDMGVKLPVDVPAQRQAEA